MVLLKQETSIDGKAFPYTHWWDGVRRKKHNHYEDKINAIRYETQRWLQTPFWANFMFPKYYQHHLLDLEIYKAVQKLGEFTDDEVKQYALICPSIKANLKASFGTPFPLYGSATGAGLFAYFFKARFNLVHVVFASLVPVLAEVVWQKWDTAGKHETLKFLEWDIENRKARSLLETQKERFDKAVLEAFKEAHPNKTVHEAYRDYLKYLGNLDK